MDESALSEEAMLTGLRDIRLPADAPGGLLAEALAALALGLLLAVMLGCLLRLVTQMRPRLQTANALDDLDTLPEEDQRLALLKRLKAGAPERYASLTQALYQPGGLPDISTLRAEVQRDD